MPLAAWAGIMIADITLRQKPYDDTDLFRSAGRYRAVDPVSMVSFLVCVAIGWGLVINQYEGVSWNDWQGYLLEPLGLGGRQGPWAYANIGVIAALVLGFLLTVIGRRGIVRRQEAIAPSTAVDAHASAGR